MSTYVSSSISARATRDEMDGRHEALLYIASERRA